MPKQILRVLLLTAARPFRSGELSRRGDKFVSRMMGTYSMRLPLACSILPILSMSLTSTSIDPGASALAIQSEQSAPASSVNVERRYRDGETLRYEMKGKVQGWVYQLQADSVVKKDRDGVFYEDIDWSHFHSEPPVQPVPAKEVSIQSLSLADQTHYQKLPDLRDIRVGLVAPMRDMMAFYNDVSVVKQAKLSREGQHATAHGTPNSWADRRHILTGEDSFDFDLTFVSADSAEHSATFLVRRIAPANPQVRLMADWMKAPVGSGMNNWVQVNRTADGGYMAQVGQETSDVHLKLDTRDGKILSADLHNTVMSVRRNCADRALLKCEAPKPESTVRDVSLSFVPDGKVP